MTETVRVSRLAKTIAAATIAAIVFIPAWIVFLLVSRYFGVTSISVETIACFGIGWTIADFTMSAWWGSK